MPVMGSKQLGEPFDALSETRCSSQAKWFGVELSLETTGHQDQLKSSRRDWHPPQTLSRPKSDCQLIIDS